MKVRFTLTARNELRDGLDYIAGRNPAGSRRVAARIRRAIEA